MPDHAHLVIQPLEKDPGKWFTLAEIMKGLKGASARRNNQLLGTRRTVWQDESYDRIIRDDRELEEMLQYCYDNPVKAGLVARSEDYEFYVWPPETDGRNE